MSEEVRDAWEGLEVHIIPPGEYFTNLLWNEIHQNRFDFYLKIGLGHTQLMSKLVIMARASKEEIQSEKVRSMKGEEISD